MVGVYKTGYLNKALGKTDSLKTENSEKKKKKKKTPGPHGCKPEGRQKKKGQMMTESGAATPCKNMILVG